MALTPFLKGFWNDAWQDMADPSLLFGQHFGQPISDELLQLYPGRSPLGRVQLRQPPQQTGLSQVVNNENEFKVTMDVHHFGPEEINIKTKDNRLVITGKHEEKADQHGFISREFTRQYVLPKDVDPSSVTSSLSADGVLTMKAPKLALKAPQERNIPIKHEGDNWIDLLAFTLDGTYYYSRFV